MNFFFSLHTLVFTAIKKDVMHNEFVAFGHNWRYLKKKKKELNGKNLLKLLGKII